MGVRMSEVRTILEGVISALSPDGRYALEDTTFSTSWTVSPDSEKELSPRDLLAAIHIGGGLVRGEMIEYPILTMVMVADYHGTRTSTGSGDDLTAMDRVQAVALHVLEAFERAPIPGAAISATSYDTPRGTGDGLWISTVVEHTLAISRR